MTPLTIKDIALIVSEAESNNIESKKDGNEILITNDLQLPNDEHSVKTNHIDSNGLQTDDAKIEKSEDKDLKHTGDVKKSPNTESETLPVLKITLKDGKQVISQVDDKDDKKTDKRKTSSKDKSSKHSKSSKERHSSNHDNKKSSSNHSSKSRSSDSNEKHRSSHRSSSSSKHSNKEKSKDSSKSHSTKSRNDDSGKSSKHKDEVKDKLHKEKVKEKDKDVKSGSTEKEKEGDKVNDKHLKREHKDIPLQPSIHKVGKIPKLSDVKKDKPSISIEVRKPDEPKPKTVKTFNSKFRKHGLEEETKPPPSRASVLTKKVTAVSTTVPIPKRSSPVHTDIAPPEKKPKILETVDKPGAIKLIPAKPKRKYPFARFLNNIITYFLFSGHLYTHLSNFYFFNFNIIGESTQLIIKRVLCKKNLQINAEINILFFVAN